MSDFNRKKIKPIPFPLHSKVLPFSREGNKKIFPYFRLFKLLIWIIVIIGFISYFSYLSFKSENITSENKIISIRPGDTFLNLQTKFKGLDSFWYKIYLQKNKPHYELQAGDYKIEKDLKIKDFINSFKNPIIKEEKLTILEGWNIFDIDKYLTKAGLIKKGNYISYVENKIKIKKLTEFFPFLKGLNTLEGFLYPDTYKINKINFRINNFVIKQLENFEKRIQVLNIDKKKIRETMILASILEKEEKNSKNKPVVAGILKKRLDEGWMIGADITVCYPHKLTSQECKMVVSKYIKEKNKYNTRTMAGLPKTPIGNPSFETINATINYKKTPYYFYLHSKNGKIYYAKTNAGHENNKRNYLY